MAGTTQYFGVTYPTSTDYVKDGATAIEAVADGFDAAVAIPTYNTQTGTSYTFALLDAAKVVTSNNAAAVTFTIPPQVDVVWTTGATLTVANYGAGAVTIAGGAGVTVTNAGATIGQFSSASIIRTASNAWTVIPFAGGAALLSDSAISGTTGSPTTTTYTSGGINYKTYAFTGSGSITLSKAGLVDLLIVGGGAGGGSYFVGGGGGGGQLNALTAVYLPSGAQTVTIGAGGTGARTGEPTLINYLYGVGGGSGGFISGSVNLAGGNGGNGGGGTRSPGTAGGTTNVLTGFSGGVGVTSHAGGGGGASAAGSAGVSGTAGAGGAGAANTLRLGTSVTYAGGGGGGAETGTAGTGGSGGGGAGAVGSATPTAGTANTGGGGGGAGGGTGAVIGASGGSGLLVVRVLA